MAANLAGDREGLLPPLTAACSGCANNKSFNRLWARHTVKLLIMQGSPAQGLLLLKTVKCNRGVAVTVCGE